VYGIVDKVNAELGLPSIEDMAETTTKMVDAENGLGLDVPCGTGFVTRHLAQKKRLVYRIDISMSMLEEATEYAWEKGIGNIRFARGMAERLPLPDDLFDGVTCSEDLHLFQDTAEALSEMARVMKNGARLAVLTFVKQGISALKMISERAAAGNPLDEETQDKDILHIFDVEELGNYLSQAGFEGFAYDIYGPWILFHAEKG